MKKMNSCKIITLIAYIRYNIPSLGNNKVNSDYVESEIYAI